MTSPGDDEAMKMARRIAANMPGVNALQRCAFLDGEWDDAPTVQAALAAIIETQELIENFVGSHSRHADPADISAAIRSGQQFRKDV